VATKLVGMPHPTPLPSPLGDVPFTVATARDAGISRKRLRAGDLIAPFRGVRADASTIDSIPSLASAYATKMPAHQIFSHTTAAALLGMRMPEGLRESTIHVTSFDPHRAPRGARISGHRTRTARTTNSPTGLRVTDPVQTWCDLSTILDTDGLIVVGDGLVQRNRPVSTITTLAQAVDARHGLRGQVALIRALADIRSNTDSARETLLRLLLLRAGFPEPEVNGQIHNRLGARIAHGDLVFREYMTVVEYDGEQHRLDERQFNIDIDRLDDLREEGWRVIRVTKNLMHRRATLFGRVEAALTAGGWRRATVR
jgi:very-short-patch-repair endonuclease